MRRIAAEGRWGVGTHGGNRHKGRQRMHTQAGASKKRKPATGGNMQQHSQTAHDGGDIKKLSTTADNGSIIYRVRALDKMTVEEYEQRCKRCAKRVAGPSGDCGSPQVPAPGGDCGSSRAPAPGDCGSSRALAPGGDCGSPQAPAPGGDCGSPEMLVGVDLGYRVLGPEIGSGSYGEVFFRRCGKM